MPTDCIIKGCKNRNDRTNRGSAGKARRYGMFKIPGVRLNEGEDVRELTEKRRRLWIKAINRKDFFKLKNHHVCSAHFVSGKPAYRHFPNDPDWLPSLNLPHHNDEQMPKVSMIRSMISKQHKPVSPSTPSCLQMSSSEFKSGIQIMASVKNDKRGQQFSGDDEEVQGQDIEVKDEPSDADYDLAEASNLIPSEAGSSRISRNSSPELSHTLEIPSSSFPCKSETSPQSSDSQIPLSGFDTGSSTQSKMKNAVQDIVDNLLRKNETLLAMNNTKDLRPKVRRQTLTRQELASLEKTKTVQNVVEGLLKSNATLLAKSDVSGLKPRAQMQTTQESSSQANDEDLAQESSILLEKRDAETLKPNTQKQKAQELSSEANIFPVSLVSRSGLTQNHGKVRGDDGMFKLKVVRPKSPTRQGEAVMRDRREFSYSLIESFVGDEEAETDSNVQNHKLVCAIASKPHVPEKCHNFLSSLDSTFFWCNFCSYTTPHKSLLVQHIKEHRFGCKYCPYESFCRSDIVRHMAKMHSGFDETSLGFSYCTFLFDFLRVTSRSDDNESSLDSEDDILETPKAKLNDCLQNNLKRMKGDSTQPVKAAKADQANLIISNPDEKQSASPGNSRKKQNYRRYPQPNEADYDMLDMEVEEINEETGAASKGDASNDIAYLCSSEQSKSSTHPSNVHSSEEVSPNVSMYSYPPSPIQEQNSSTVGSVQSPGYNSGNCIDNKASLYWNCGYCDFQSNSEAEIKEHSKRNHLGRPHRLVALIKNMKRGQTLHIGRKKPINKSIVTSNLTFPGPSNLKITSVKSLSKESDYPPHPSNLTSPDQNNLKIVSHKSLLNNLDRPAQTSNHTSHDQSNLKIVSYKSLLKNSDHPVQSSNHTSPEQSSLKIVSYKSLLTNSNDPAQSSNPTSPNQSNLKTTLYKSLLKNSDDPMKPCIKFEEPDDVEFKFNA